MTTPAWLAWHAGAAQDLSGWKEAAPEDQGAWFWVWTGCPLDERRARVAPPEQAWAMRTAQGLLGNEELLRTGMNQVLTALPDSDARVALLVQWMRAAPSFRNPTLEALVWEAMVPVVDALAGEVLGNAPAPYGGADNEEDGHDCDDDEYDDHVSGGSAHAVLSDLSNLYMRPKLPAAPAHLPFLRGLLAAGLCMEGTRYWMAANFQRKQNNDWMAPFFEKVRDLHGKLTKDEVDRWAVRWQNHGGHPAFGFLESQQLMEMAAAAPRTTARRGRI